MNADLIVLAMRRWPLDIFFCIMIMIHVSNEYDYLLLEAKQHSYSYNININGKYAVHYLMYVRIQIYVLIV